MKTKTLTKRNNRVLTAVLLPTSAALLAGCTDNSDNPVTDNNQPSALSHLFRVLFTLLTLKWCVI